MVKDFNAEIVPGSHRREHRASFYLRIGARGDIVFRTEAPHAMARTLRLMLTERASGAPAADYTAGWLREEFGLGAHHKVFRVFMNVSLEDCLVGPEAGLKGPDPVGRALDPWSDCDDDIPYCFMRTPPSAAVSFASELLEAADREVELNEDAVTGDILRAISL